MAILIDPPRWPAHGTIWSHLVSDVSYDELHLFARGVAIPRRGFDLDHYDVPAAMFDVVVATGAQAVESRVLLFRLRGAGLRVRQADRHVAARRHRKAFLRAEWAALGAGLGVVDDVAWGSLGEDLLLRWSESHRRYHDVVHLHDVLLALDQLADLGEALPPAVQLAAWFHDAVYDGVAGEDERHSAALAVVELPRVGVAAGATHEVARLVLATTPGTERSTDHAAMVLGDADLAILASGPKRYAAYAAAVREEYAHVPEADFRHGRATILEGFLRAPRLYGTGAAHARWEERARLNLAGEIVELRGGPSGGVSQPRRGRTAL